MNGRLAPNRMWVPSASVSRMGGRPTSHATPRVLGDRVQLGNWVGHDYGGRGGRADSDGPSHRDGPACSGAWFWHHL